MRAVVPGRLPLVGLAIVAATTAAWWALALWPVGPDGPQWVLRTRDVCFGATGDAPPAVGGWLLLVGQPLGMALALLLMWGTELKAGLIGLTRQTSGQIVVGLGLAMTLTGIVAAATRVHDAWSTPSFAAVPAPALARGNEPAPELSLTDQTGRTVTLAAFRGRPVLVTFAYAHCQTVCPQIVSNVLAARQRSEKEPPVVLLVTLDPWRDTAARLPALARVWGLDGDAYVLSGTPDEVERTLGAWHVPHARDERTGDIAHTSLVYVVGPDGRLAYVVSGTAEAISAAMRAL